MVGFDFAVTTALLFGIAPVLGITHTERDAEVIREAQIALGVKSRRIVVDVVSVLVKGAGIILVAWEDSRHMSGKRIITSWVAAINAVTRMRGVVVGKLTSLVITEGSAPVHAARHDPADHGQRIGKESFPTLGAVDGGVNNPALGRSFANAVPTDRATPRRCRARWSRSSSHQSARTSAARASGSRSGQ